jgi:amino acid transporter
VAVAFSTLLALGLIFYVTRDPDSNVVGNLSNVTSLLLLCVFAVVNVACLVLRRRTSGARPDHFRSPGALPVVAAVLCLFLAGPWVERDAQVYGIAGVLMLIGVLLWAITWVINRVTGTADSDFEDVGRLGG